MRTDKPNELSSSSDTIAALVLELDAAFTVSWMLALCKAVITLNSCSTTGGAVLTARDAVRTAPIGVAFLAGGGTITGFARGGA